MLGIVLVEPEIPQNTGNIARTCAVTGCTLHLVGPLGFSIDDKKLKRAGLDYWHLLDVRYYDSLDEFGKRTRMARIFTPPARDSSVTPMYPIRRMPICCLARRPRDCRSIYSRSIPSAAFASRCGKVRAA